MIKWRVVDAFRHLGAETSNKFAWSAQNPAGDVTVITLWQDEIQDDGVTVRVNFIDDPKLGTWVRERGNVTRRRHLQAVWEGDRTFRVIMLQAQDTKSIPRKAIGRWPEEHLVMKLLEFDPEAGAFRAEGQRSADQGRLKAVESRAETRSIAALWQRSFRDGAEIIGSMDGRDVLWHGRLGIWGSFGKTQGKGGVSRDWNPFGQKPGAFRSNIIVEINQPPAGIDTNLQAVFARDAERRLWLLHQGRMSVAGSRVTEADFISATGLQPVTVEFSDGSTAAYHQVAQLDGPPASVQESISAFIAQCARARTFKLAAGAPVPNLDHAQDWERGFSPESIGSYQVKAREAAVAERLHGEIQRALAAELSSRKTPHSNDRVGQYGPDLYTYGRGPKVLFEIKSRTTANEVFAAVGQLHIYDRLLGGGYRKVLVVPKGIRSALQGPVAALNIDTIEFVREGRKTLFDPDELTRCLK